MNLGIKAGQKFTAIKTDTNDKCGVKAGQASGWVCLVKDELVSFYLQRNNGLGYIEAKMPVSHFVMNFELLAMMNVGYVRTRHYLKNYPADFLK